MAAIGTPVSLGTNKAIDTSADLTVTLSRAFTTNALVFCAVVLKREDSIDPTDPAAPTGGGVTWEKETSYTYKTTGGGRAKIVVYRALASSPSGTSVVIVTGQTVSNILSYVIEVTGTVLTGNGANALLQEVTALAGASATGPRAAMVTLSSADNGFLTFGSFTRGGAARTFTPVGPTTPTELGEQNNVAASTGSAGIQAQYVLAALDVNPSIGFDLSGAPDNSGIVAYEIGAGPVGPTINTQPTAVTTVIAGPVSNNPATFTVSATTSGGSLTYDWELETSVGGGVYANLSDGNGATWTGQASASCSATLTATTLSGRRVRCNVTDDNGTTTSDAVALTIYAGTTIAQPAATDGSGQATAVLTTDVADTANGQLKLITFTRGSTVLRTTARKTS